MNAHEARDNSRDRTDDIADRWLRDGLASADVTAAARAKAEAEVRRQQTEDFEKAVNAAIEQVADATATKEGN